MLLLFVYRIRSHLKSSSSVENFLGRVVDLMKHVAAVDAKVKA
jgi:hypothetical protein